MRETRIPSALERPAESRESSPPGDAIEVYFRLADVELETTGRPAYNRAAGTCSGKHGERPMPPDVEQSSVNIWLHCESDSASDRRSSKLPIGRHFAE